MSEEQRTNDDYRDAGPVFPPGAPYSGVMDNFEWSYGYSKRFCPTDEVYLAAPDGFVTVRVAM